ncbi:2-keto-4-pentenoate hydratase [Pseudonocardia sp.]|uniref:2-keto-4-pentenoate hydratase n=1 Tax=Pseudonocardia sp. TaxID=60912 RepID=UPI003D0DB19A
MDARAIADELLVARRERKAILPFTDANPFFSVETAYEVQRFGIEDRLAEGHRVVGAKLGLTSRVKREAMGIHEPLYGWLTSDMVHPSGERLPLDELIAPRAEPEIAFLLGDVPQAPATVPGVLAATAAVFAAIEVVDSRYRDFRFRLSDSVADDAGAGRVVLGPRACPPTEVENLRLVGCVLRARGEVVGTAASAAVMGHPAAAVAWLVNALAARGESLEKGMVVLSGGLTTPVSLSAGSVVSAEFDGLGSVEVHC